MRLLLVCLAGALGTGARYLIADAFARWLGPGVPWATLTVNVTGSFLIGLVQHAALATGAISETTRLMLTVGVLGGFTTYSSFSYETIALAETGAWGLAAANVLVTTALCLGGCVLGIEAARLLARW